MSNHVLRFAVVMQDKLDENDHKRHWRTCSAKWLLNRLKQETAELERAVGMGAAPDVVEREAADVANFAMMVADVYAIVAAQTTKPEGGR